MSVVYHQIVITEVVTGVVGLLIGGGIAVGVFGWIVLEIVSAVREHVDRENRKPVDPAQH